MNEYCDIDQPYFGLMDITEKGINPISVQLSLPRSLYGGGGLCATGAASVSQPVSRTGGLSWPRGCRGSGK